MRSSFLGLTAASALIVATSGLGAAQAAPAAQPVPAVYGGADVLPLLPAQFFFGGQNYCWYPNGWRGPGFYWCGYAWRSGLGWGGGDGWHGWHNGGGGHGGHNGGGHHSGGHAGGHVGGHTGGHTGGHAGGHASGGHTGGGHKH